MSTLVTRHQEKPEAAADVNSSLACETWREICVSVADISQSEIVTPTEMKSTEPTGKAGWQNGICGCVRPRLPL